MKKSLPIFLLLLFNLDIASSEIESIRAFINRYPGTTTLTCAAALYLSCYITTQLTTQSEPVKLVEATEKSQTDQPIFLFSHGLAETHEQAFWYTKGKTSLPAIIDGHVYSFDYPDATRWPWRIHFPQTSLGQFHETLALKSAYDQVRKEENHSSPFILVGLSRGATAILNLLGDHNPHIDAAIVESPFDSMRTIVSNLLNYIYMSRIPGLQTGSHFLVSALFWQHRMSAPDTTQSIPTIDPAIPILFICSKEDRLIPASSTITLYKLLRAQGHRKVHIFIADHGRHGRILHGPDGKKYQQIVHAFYKKYGFSHDESLALDGQELLDNSQPLL